MILFSNVQENVPVEIITHTELYFGFRNVLLYVERRISCYVR